MRHLRCLFSFLLLLCSINACVYANVLTIEDNRILQDGLAIKMVGLRCSNALQSDSSTDDLVDALDLYQEYGLNAISVFLMGSRFGDIKGYRPDGSLNPVYLGRLERILDAARSRGMVVIVGCLYWSTSRAKEDLVGWTQQDANHAIAETARWLRGKGYRNVILDPDNEGMAGRAMQWQTEDMVRAAKSVYPHLLVANNTHKPAPSADLNMHFGPRNPAKPYLDSESTPGNTPFKGYWGKFSKETHQDNPSFYNYSRIGRYTEEMKQSQFEITRELLTLYNGILLASTWLQCGSQEGIPGPISDLGGYSILGSGTDLSAKWNRDINTLHTDAGVRWWMKFVRDLDYSR